MVAAVIAFVIAGVGSVLAVRFLRRRYRELYGSDDPPYEDPPIIPIQGSHGGLM